MMIDDAMIQVEPATLQFDGCYKTPKKTHVIQANYVHVAHISTWEHTG